MALEHEALTERKNLEDLHFAVFRSQLKAVGRQSSSLDTVRARAGCWLLLDRGENRQSNNFAVPSDS
jgi:hypothetical protein